ncbi:MAG: DUF5043 domain-containing protein [Bacteroidaceae bacterium]|nr:DUF5043 domain-containing protein [Bacteroidaceae bacterium]
MRTLFLTIALLFVANGLFSQTNYYTETKTFYEDGYTYQVNTDTDIELYNKDNKWVNVEQKYKFTGELYFMSESDARPIYKDSWLMNRTLLYSIIESGFTKEQKEFLCKDDYDIIITLYINSETGKVDDVSFTFDEFSAFKYIPVSVFREIELKIKERLTFAVTEEGKKLNYIFYWDYYKFK